MVTNPITLQTWDKNNHLPAAKIIQGDILSRSLTVTLVSSPKQPVDLTGAEARLYLQQPDGTTDQVTATIIDAAAGQIQATLPPLPPGKVSGTVRVAWQNGGGVLYVPPFDIAVARNYAYAAYTHIRYAMDASGLGMTDKASLWESSGRNYIKNGLGDKKDGFFLNFDKVNGYGEKTIKSKKIYTFVDLTQGYLIKIQDYIVGEKVKFSYDIMYTKWDFPAGTSVGELAMGQRYASPFIGVTYVNLPQIEGKNKIGEWIHVQNTITIYPPPDNYTGTQTRMQFYNPNPDVEAQITLRIKNVKLERGDTHTPWSPAPEDYPPDYRQPYIGICQTNDPIAPTDPAMYVWTENKGGNI